MSDDELEKLRYPVGHPVLEKELSPEARAVQIARIAAFPAKMRALVADLDEAQLETPYRPGGWTVRQVVNHVADSHMNAYVRFKLALTEHHPTICPYDETAWAKLADTAASPIPEVLDLVQLLHQRWLRLIAAIPAEGWSRTYFHPEAKIAYTLDKALCMYGWHCLHHAAHVEGLRERSGW